AAELGLERAADDGVGELGRLVLEGGELVDEDLGEDVPARRQELAHLEEAAALGLAELAEAAGVLGVEPLERARRAGAREEGGLGEVEAVGAGDLAERHAGGRHAQEALLLARGAFAEGAELREEARPVLAGPGHRFFGGLADLPDALLDERSEE